MKKKGCFLWVWVFVGMSVIIGHYKELVLPLDAFITAYRGLTFSIIPDTCFYSESGHFKHSQNTIFPVSNLIIYFVFCNVTIGCPQDFLSFSIVCLSIYNYCPFSEGRLDQFKCILVTPVFLLWLTSTTEKKVMLCIFLPGAGYDDSTAGQEKEDDAVFPGGYY